MILKIKNNGEKLWYKGRNWGVEMKIEKIKDGELLKITEKLVVKEREITTRILEYLMEIDRRRLYVEVGMPSLFKYCTRVLKYSESEASCRIQAMRLMREYPEVKESIDVGDLTLTNASKIQTFFKQESERVDKPNIIESALNKSGREVDTLLNERRVSSPKRKINIVLNEKMVEKLDKIKKDFL